MRWFQRFRRPEPSEEEIVDFKVDAYVARAKRGEVPKDVAVRRLREERDRVRRRLNSLEKAQARMTPRRMRSIGGSGPRMGPEIMRAELQLQHEASVNAGKSRAEVTLEEQLRLIDRGISHLRSIQT